MNTVFAGHLDMTVKDLLRSIAQRRLQGVSFLQLASADNQIAGRIFVFGGNRIIGACLTDSFVSGYPALKALMSIRMGKYALVSVEPSDGVNVNHSIDMETTALVEQMGSLPELPGPPVNQESLFRKILSSRAKSGVQSMVSPLHGGLSLNPNLVSSDALVGLGTLISRIFKAPAGGSNLRYASLAAVAAVFLAVILGWKALGPANGLTWPSFLPAQSHSSVSLNGTGSGVRSKKLERSAHAKHRKRN